MHSSRILTDRCSGHHWMSLRAGKWADHLQADPPPPWRQTPVGKDPPEADPREQTDASENITFPCGR